MNKIIIGVAGTFASGQDSVGKYLAEKYNFLYVSTSDMVREEALKRHGSIERPVLFKTANELRYEQGGGVLAELGLQKFKANIGDYSGVTITGIRSLGEAKAIQKAGGVMIFTDANMELRYSRMQDRRRDGEAEISLEQFKQREAKEASTGTTDADFNREAIRKLSDYFITNNSTLSYFHGQIDKLFTTLSMQL